MGWEKKKKIYVYARDKIEGWDKPEKAKISSKWLFSRENLFGKETNICGSQILFLIDYTTN